MKKEFIFLILFVIVGIFVYMNFIKTQPSNVNTGSSGSSGNDETWLDLAGDAVVDIIKNKNKS